MAEDFWEIGAPGRTRTFDHRPTAEVRKRDLFGELLEGVGAMPAHREGRITVRSHYVERLVLPRIDQKIIRSGGFGSRPLD